MSCFDTRSFNFSVSSESFDYTSNKLTSSSTSSFLLVFSIWLLIKTMNIDIKLKKKWDDNSKQQNGGGCKRYLLFGGHAVVHLWRKSISEGHSGMEDWEITIIDRAENVLELKRRESYWQYRLDTSIPNGLIERSQK